jgi:hypothetical protein
LVSFVVKGFCFPISAVTRDVGDSGDSRAAFAARDAVRPSFSGLRFSQEIQTGNSTGE